VDHRHNAIEHLYTAQRHGFFPPTFNAPIIIADGLFGQDFYEVEITGDHFSKVHISSAIHHADAILVATHFKGHVVTGFGGAIKNLGMGSASRASKLDIHGAVAIISNRCNGCGKCLDCCPLDAISLDRSENRAHINAEKCDGCG
jgi:uncharacterized Fe-S center protein